MSSQLLSECEVRRFEPGMVVIAQGAPSRGVLIVRRGRLTAYRVELDGTRTRLRSFGELTVVGEVGLIADAPQVAEVIAEGTTDGWWLSTNRYQELKATKPWLLLDLYELIARSRAERANSFSHSFPPIPTSLFLAERQRVRNRHSVPVNSRLGHGTLGHV